MKKIVMPLIILVLVVLVLVQKYPSSTLQDLPELTRFEFNDVQKVVIKQNDKIIIKAQLKEKKWLLSDSVLAIKTNVVEQLLLDLRDMQVKRVVSHKPDNFTSFSVTDFDATVLLSDSKGEPLLHIIVGKPATDLLSTYIRIVGEDRVLTVDKILTWQVKRTADAWLVEEESSE